MKWYNKIITFILFALASTLVSAQQVSIKAQPDSTVMFIGSQIGLNIEVQMPETLSARLIQLSDSLSKNVEIVEALKIDSTVQNGILKINQRYLITSFDTGLFYIPPFDIIELADGEKQKTEGFALLVVNPFQSIEIDEQSGVAKITDIRKPYDAPFILSELLEYWPWAVGALLLIGAIIGFVIWYKRYKLNKIGKPIKKQKPIEPCHVTALRDLQRIKDEKIWQRNLFKEYFSDITDTLRRYISARFEINAMESTSDEIIDSLKEQLKEYPNDKQRLEQILELADLVKFAKQEPLPDENDMAIKHAIEFVNDTIPQPKVEQNSKTEAQ